MQHSPIKPVVHTVHAAQPTPGAAGGQEESLAGLMGMTKAQQVVHDPNQQPMQAPMDHGESLSGLINSQGQQPPMQNAPA